MEETIEILSVPVRNVSMDEATDFVFSRIAEGRATTVATANAEMIMRAKEDHELARILAEALSVFGPAFLRLKKSRKSLKIYGIRGHLFYS